MRSAQRKQRLQGKVRQGKALFFFKILVIPILLLILFLVVKLSTKYWNGFDKFSYVYRNTSGDAVVTVLDPKLGDSTTFIIPGDTQVDVVGNYGTLKIKNVWQLSMNEKKGGKLLSGTVTKNFLFPVFLWSDSDAESVGHGNIPGIFKFIISPKNTNIPLGDRLSMAFFALNVKGINRTEIDLAKSQFLKKSQLNDGTVGYTLSGPVSTRLTVYFSDNVFADKSMKVEIIDQSGEGSADTVGAILQVMGGKVVSVQKNTGSVNFDCLVLGSDLGTIRKIATLFSCKISEEKSVFDLEIRLGEGFAKRF